MIIGMKKYFNNKAVVLRRSRVSDIKLKDLILKSNKQDVVDFALEHIKKNDNYDFINRLVTDSEDYICPINNREHLEMTYDFIYDISEKEYLDEEMFKYLVMPNSGKCGGFPFGFDKFVGVVLIDDNLESTDRFVKVIEDEKILPIEFLINCRIAKSNIDIPISKMVGLCLLQICYIQELNKF